MMATPASTFQPFILYVYHRETPGGVSCVCGRTEGDVIRQTVATGPPGLAIALDEAETAVDEDTDCAGSYEASGPSGYTRTYP